MVASRSNLPPTAEEIAHGIPMFIDQLIKTLRIEQTSSPLDSRAVSGIAGSSGISQIGEEATLHGRDLLDKGFTLEQVVRDYGDVCQAVTNLAYELDAPIAVDEFRTLNRCLDNATASAVTAYADQKAATSPDNVHVLDSRLGPLAHELRNYLHIASYAVRAIKAGTVGISGATGAVLDRSLIGMRNLVDRSLAEVRVSAGLPPRLEPIRLCDFLSEVQASASLESRAQGCQLTIVPSDADLAIYADPEMLHAAVYNLLHNAFKFTQRHTAVTLHAHEIDGRVLIDIADHCGGLPAGALDTLLLPFRQNGGNRSGLGLGLDICRRSVEANKGTLRVRDVPGSGCVFTVDLPRYSIN
jgi:signal transduction histidine kinase